MAYQNQKVKARQVVTPNTQTKDLGIVSNVPMGDWNAATNYQKLNLVRYSGATYIALKSSQGVEPTVTTGWQQVWQLVVQDGRGVSSTTIAYQAGISNTTPPTGEWEIDIPDVPQGQYLWTQTIYNFTDGSQTVSYTVSLQGLGFTQTDRDNIERITEAIPSSASESNPLTTQDFVNSSINNMAAFYITYNTSGDAFPTRADLLSATTFYYGGQVRTPTQNDYAIVLADESQPKGADGNYPTTRYSYQGSAWSFQYVVNNTSLTQAQVDAINSGITAELVEQIGIGSDFNPNGIYPNLVGREATTEAVGMVYGKTVASGNYATALGYGAAASLSYSTAVGHSATANRANSTALGVGATASGQNAIALGVGATASSHNSTALGYNATASSGNYSVAIGYTASTSNTNAIALGTEATAGALNAMALGIGANASGQRSVALGRAATATSADATAVGSGSTANGTNTIALGYSATASATNAIALGFGATANGTRDTIAVGRGATAISGSSIAVGYSATAGGYNTIALGVGANVSAQNSIGLGHNATANSNFAMALGYGAAAVGINATALGAEANASNIHATALGTSSTAGSYGTALGYCAVASGTGSSALGYNATADVVASIALGRDATADGSGSTALGVGSTASSNYSTALGYGAEASGISSVALGRNASATTNNSIVLGNANIVSLQCAVQTITSLSDERTKEDITYANTARCLEIVEELPVKRFQFKKFARPNPLDKHRLGFIAQDVEKVFPNNVETFDEEYPVLDENGQPVYEYETDENGGYVYEQIGENDDGEPIYATEPNKVEKKFTMKDVKHLGFDQAIPSLWGAVQELTRRVKALEEKLK